jgi:hypothetical protein
MSEDKKQIKGVLYEEEKIQGVLKMLDTINISGFNQVKVLNRVFDVLTNPIPFNNSGEEVSNE